jgi:hypothetical protein
MNSDPGNLFCNGTLLEFIQRRNAAVSAEIDALPEAALLAGGLETYAAALVENYSLEVMPQ